MYRMGRFSVLRGPITVIFPTLNNV
jgi:hypothetical protein